MLQCENLACRRGERMLFSGLDFALSAGEVLLLTGPNGSGKSSLMRMLAGLLGRASGRIVWNGHDIDDDIDLYRLDLIYAGHADAVKPGLTAREQLAFHAELMGAGRTDHPQIDQTLERIGLGAKGTMPGRHFSAGQKRRLNLARLLVAPRKLWLLDEPTTSLDAAGVAMLATLVDEHRKAGGMVIAATHADLPVTSARILELGRVSRSAAA